MIRTNQKMLTTFAAMAACAVAAPAAFADDLRSPDSKERAIATQPATSGSVDLRSPDSKERAIATQRGATGYVDLRSPDAKEVGQSPQRPEPVASSKPDGFEWGYPAAGAGAGAALLLLAIFLTRRRARSVREARVPAVTS
jgi:hypothetical protein